MPEPTLPIDLLAAIDAACDRYESAWIRTGEQDAGPLCERFAEGLPEAIRTAALPELFAIERQYRAKRGEEATQWVEDRPAIEALASCDEAETLSAPSISLPHSTTMALRVRCPHCAGEVTTAIDAPLDEIICDACGKRFGLTEGLDGTDDDAFAIGRFLIRDRLGAGAFGTVWRARDPELDRDVALKTPRRGMLSPHEAEMFFREARAAAQLTHPGIVSVHEVGRDDRPGGTGSIYIVSELVDGEPLSDRLKAWRPTPRHAAALVADIADALEYAHSRGVIHRDLKPSNIMLDRYAPGGETAVIDPGGLGRPRLMDFGLAKRDAGEITMTIEGQVLGTPAYMSPEQASGQVRWVDRRSDIYALGVVLFRLLTGELPFRGAASSQIQQRITDDAPSPRRLDDRVPLDLANVCLKCLERDPNRRYDHAADVAAEMRRFLGGEPVLARPLSVWGRAGRWARRRPATATACVLGALLAGGGPMTAAIIASRNAELERRLQEIVRQEQRQSVTVDRLEAEKDLARAAPSRLIKPVGVADWRRDLIGQVLAEHGERLVAAARSDGGQEGRFAVARLLLAVGRIEEAAALLGEVVESGKADPAVLPELRAAVRQAGAARQHAAAGASGSTAEGETRLRRLQDDNAALVGAIPAGTLTAEQLAQIAGALLEEEVAEAEAPDSP